MQRCCLTDKVITVTATGFGVGFSRHAPGTLGTLVGVPVYLVFSHFPWFLYLVSIIALSFLAIYVSQEAEKIFNTKDASQIVIDEIAGFQFTMFLVTPTIAHVAAGFILFRIFDIVKPFPIRFCEGRLRGGYGVVGDDVVAGIYGNIVLLLLITFTGI
jgi:phosphatidylglycerophosphatase A